MTKFFTFKLLIVKLSFMFTGLLLESHGFLLAHVESYCFVLLLKEFDPRLFWIAGEM